MNLAVIGGGRMGSSLVRGLQSSGLIPSSSLHLTSSTPERSRLAAETLGISHAETNLLAASHAEVIVLSVKPAKALSVVSEMAPALPGKLLISMVAGIRGADLALAAGTACRVIRVMPNTAIRLLKGVTAIAPHETATPEDAALVARLFGAVGLVEEVSERDLDIVTAVSGSGPALALLMLESMADAGVSAGLDADQSLRMAAGAFAAAADLVRITRESPAMLRAEITSPGGTTAAGLAILEKGGFPATVRASVEAAAARSAELSSGK